MSRTAGRINRMVATALLVVWVAVGPATSQSDPTYHAARESGGIGEQTGGFLGIVGTATPALQKMDDNLNNLRRADYAKRAQANGATLIDYSAMQGCIRVSHCTGRDVPSSRWQLATA